MSTRFQIGRHRQSASIRGDSVGNRWGRDPREIRNAPSPLLIRRSPDYFSLFRFCFATWIQKSRSISILDEVRSERSSRYRERESNVRLPNNNPERNGGAAGVSIASRRGSAWNRFESFDKVEAHRNRGGQADKRYRSSCLVLLAKPMPHSFDS